MMHSGEQLAHRHMDIVSTHLGEGWRDIIRLLGFSDGQIEQLYEDNYARGIKEVIYGFLLDYQRNDAQASVGHLTRLLWKAGRRECVYILKEYWKGTQRADASTSNAFDSQQTNPNCSKLNDESVS